ncbi:hypothetical protein F25303_622 [Fusarium sp. NRRL 25303]|nr:hypothetical protein F25303_622 [Fusarium sp. NRRL 25303]
MSDRAILMVEEDPSRDENEQRSRKLKRDLNRARKNIDELQRKIINTEKEIDEVSRAKETLEENNKKFESVIRQKGGGSSRKADLETLFEESCQRSYYQDHNRWADLYELQALKLRGAAYLVTYDFRKCPVKQSNTMLISYLLPTHTQVTNYLHGILSLFTSPPDDIMPEDNPQDNNPSENFATGNATQSLDANVATDMVVYESQNEPSDIPPEVAAEDPPRFILQDVPENMQVNEQFRPDKGKSRESMPQEQVYGNNVPLVDEVGSQTGSRVHFDENSSTRRSREKEARRIGSHGGDSHRGESHRGESRGRDHRSTEYSEKKSHHSRKSESHRSTPQKKDTHRSSSDKKGSHRPEPRRPDRDRRDSDKGDSHKTSRKDGSHKKNMIDATPIYGRPSFFAALGHEIIQTPYVRRPIENQRKEKRR